MNRSLVIMSSTFAIIVLLISNSYSTTFASTHSENQPRDDGQNTAIKDSAIEKLALALHKDKDKGDDNGGENWNKAIESLGKEMGFPVDEDVEDALRNITELHLDNIVNQ